MPLRQRTCRRGKDRDGTAEREATLRSIDLTSWEGLFASLLGLALVTLIGVGIRLLVMFSIQQRRERLNRQINERLRTLIAAYKVLGGSFTGDLAVDPRHLREVARRGEVGAGVDLVLAEETAAAETGAEPAAAGDRARRIRDAVEAALSDIILLGTEEHVRLADRAARELVGGRPVHTHDLVVSLRNFIREALDLDPIPPDITLPMQGPTRPSGAGGRGKGDRGKDNADGAGGGGAGGAKGGGGMGGGGMGGGGAGTGQGSGAVEDEQPPSRRRP